MLGHWREMTAPGRLACLAIICVVLGGELTDVLRALCLAAAVMVAAIGLVVE